MLRSKHEQQPQSSGLPIISVTKNVKRVLIIRIKIKR